MADHRARFNPGYDGAAFIGSMDAYAAARAVLYGMPMDWTVSFRPGARFGPRRIREVSTGLEEYSPYLDRHLEDAAYFDAGDIPLPFGNAERSLAIIEDYVGRWMDDGKFPLGLGGEHLVTLGVLRAVQRRVPQVRLLHFDAHADLRDDYEGEALSHSSVVKKATEWIAPDRIYQFGVRSGTREEFSYARANTRFHPFRCLEGLRASLDELARVPVYVTVDIDVLDPAHAPGTGTAEAGGVSSAELLACIHEMKGLEVVGFDLVEVAPPLDPSEQTAVVAAKVVREALLAFVAV